MNTKQGKKATSLGAIQGDVPFRYVNGLPKNAKRRDNNVIALGEATGHYHVVDIVDGNAELFDDALGNLFIKVNAPVRVLHNQHGYIQFDKPGIVQVGRAGVMQREYTGEEERRVLD